MIAVKVQCAHALRCTDLRQVAISEDDGEGLVAALLYIEREIGGEGCSGVIVDTELAHELGVKDATMQRALWLAPMTGLIVQQLTPDSDEGWLLRLIANARQPVGQRELLTTLQKDYSERWRIGRVPTLAMLKLLEAGKLIAKTSDRGGWVATTLGRSLIRRDGE